MCLCGHKSLPGVGLCPPCALIKFKWQAEDRIKRRYDRRFKKANQ
jgi:hypothetical protein